MTKIALVNDGAYRYASSDPSAVGGSERYQWLMARALAAHGWAVVVGVRGALPRGVRTRIEQVEFVGIGTGSYLPALYRFFATERPGWCFWFGSTHWLGPAALVAAACGVRTLFSAQFDLDVQPRRALSERRGFWPLYALGLARSRKIFLQHWTQYAQLATRWQAKSHVMPGVVAMPESVVPHALRRPYVAWVGVLRQPKRPDLLIDVARACPAIEFVVCGGASNHRSPPGYSERITRELTQLPNVTYLGHVAPSRAIEVIGGAALLLSTSDAEGFPSVFVEAWAHGTPVVTLTIDPDRVIGRHGLGVVAESVDAAAKTIRRLTPASAERERIGARARDYAAAMHSAPAVAQRIEQALSAPSTRTPVPVERAVQS
jgi:glycosyltransferase involved in cell wall biosynthesis